MHFGARSSAGSGSGQVLTGTDSMRALSHNANGTTQNAIPIDHSPGSAAECVVRTPPLDRSAPAEAKWHFEIARAFENSFQHQPPTKIKMKILIIAILSTALCASPVAISLAGTPKIYVCPDCGCPLITGHSTSLAPAPNAECL